ncbi:uncharacterized protein LOC133796002 [Humulus lupulus]|uniref:uncharacterized protein LOC133796002 n=1 Tax=Humulus lupulus TaxID=3486 RepID=UPI002B4074EB|nr:uncharacterized protein LOC133796002 [Humulus lupulus]
MEYTTSREITAKTKYSRVSSWTFYRAKKKARKMLEGSVKEQYTILDDYCKRLLATNPSSTVKLKTDLVNGRRTFQRYCRGILLAAIGIDGNNSMFPIAYCVVEKENTEVWTWFLELLKDDLGNLSPTKVTMMSDCKKGLENAVRAIFSGCEVRYCVRHLHSNFKKEYPGLLLKQLLWPAANTTAQVEFARAMQEVKVVSDGAYNWLAGKNPTEWRKSHILEYPKCDILVNDLCESFNAAILNAHEKPIITLLEKIRFWLMSRFYNKKVELEKMTQHVGKRILKIIKNKKKVAKHCLVTRSDKFEFQVQRSNFSALVVDLFFKKESLWKAYEQSVHLTPSPDMWPQTGLNPIDPPLETNLPRRPKKARRKETDEPPSGSKKAQRIGQVKTCSNCLKIGHRRETCKSAKVVENRVVKKRGHPPLQKPTKATHKRKARRLKQHAKGGTSGTKNAQLDTI